MENYGPIRNLQINLKFRADGTPIPLVLVGVNGSGKSILLSVVLDAIVRMRRRVFGTSPEVAKEQLFKPMSNRVITNQSNTFALGECNFTAGDKAIRFLELVSTPNEIGVYHLPENFTPPPNFNSNNFRKVGKHKDISMVGGDIDKEISNYVFAYYPAGRTERPNWLNKDSKIEFQIAENYSGVAKYKLWRTNLIAEITTWILDIVLDAELYDFRVVDIPYNGETLPVRSPIEGPNRKILTHLNRLLTDITLLGTYRYRSVRLGISHRQYGARHVTVMGKKPDGSEESIAQSISDLSTGELMVFSMFADIIRIAELQGWDKQNLEDISGIVIIDEADLHLHIKLQKDLLPRLMANLPNIQFLMTTHSPFLPIGIANNDVDLKKMPDGISILPSDFDEFQIAYDTFVDQQKSYQETYTKLQDVIAEIEVPLIITEGKTDWRHLKRALGKLKENGEFPNLNLAFHETDSDMGDGELDKLFKAYKKIPNRNPMIFLFDCDNPTFVNTYQPEGENWLKAGSAIGMCIAVPHHRVDTPQICIEHLYFDEALMTPIPDSEKRLRFEHEIGYFADRKTAFLRPTPATQSLKIYDKNVGALGNEDGTDIGNLAISKSVFFSEIVDTDIGDDFDVQGFRLTFQRIQDALLP